MILYRPVGLQELALIYDSGMNAFPTRLPKQPIFYPVLQLEYARKTASGWNAKKGESAGYVTEFKVEDKYIGQFETHTVGKSQHEELWIPAEEMEEFNKHIVGHIKVVEAHFGDAFEGFVPEEFGLKGKNAVEQFTLLANSYLYKRMEFYLEIKRNHKAVFLNYPFWQTYEFKNPGLKEKVLQAIKEAWLTSFPKIPLPNPVPRDIQPVKQTNAAAPARHLVKPVRKDTSPVEQTDAHTQHLADPVYEDITLVESTDSDPEPLEEPDEEEITPVKPTGLQTPHFRNLVRDDIPPVKPRDARAHAQDLVDPEDADVTPVEQTGPHAQHWTDPDDEDDTLVDQADEDAEDLIDLDDEEITPVKQTDLRAWVNPVREEITPVEQTDVAAQDFEDLIEEETTPDSSLSVDSVDEEITPVEHSQRRPLLSPVHAETPLPTQTESHFLQGIALGLSGQYREAIAELSKAVDEDPDDLVAHTSLGVAFHRLGEDDRAVACYETALQIDPIYAEAHYFLANILYYHGNVRGAITGYTMALGLNPELIQAHEQPASQDRLTDYSSSPAEMYRIAKPAHRILHLNKLLESNPRQASLFKERAAEYYRLRNYAQAIADYSSSLELQPKDANIFHLRGVAYEQLGQHDRALEDYQQAIAINPQLSNEYINRGVAFGQMGNLHQSIASLTDAIRLAPKNPDGYFNRGTVYLQQGDFERAIEDFSNVIRLSPTDEEAYYWRGISNEQTGRQQEASADYRQFLALSQDENARAQIEQKIRQWNKERPSGVSSPSPVPDDGQKTNQVQAKKPEQNLDLYDLIAALGERALNSTWFGSGANCYGEKAEELYAFTDQGRPIDGRDLLSITSGIQQTIEGDFQAFDPGASSPWIFIRAWEGSGFYIETNDPKSKEHLKTHFQSVEDVDEASPPYEGMFIRI